MKNSARFLFCCCSLILACSLGISRSDTLTILHFNDSHSNLAPIGPRDANLKGTLGGIARAATLIGMTKTEDPNAIVLHGGDVFIGDLFFNKYFGVPELQMMNALGFDAMAVGNHEFDLTPATLLGALATAFPTGGFPLLSANLNLDSASVQPLGSFVRPYLIKQAGNIKVGVFGLTTPMTNLLSQPSPAFIDTNIIPIAAAMVDTLTAANCGVIICLSHLGSHLDQVLAGYVPGINVIVGAHDHYKFDTPIIVQGPTGDTCYIVQANAFYLNAGKLRVLVGGGKVRALDYRMIDLDNTIPEDPTIAATVDGLVAGIEQTYDSVFSKRIGYATADFEEVATNLTEPGLHDTPIGNLVTDAFREETHTDIAIEVGGSTAQKIYHGPLIADDLFRVVGYGYNTENGLGYHLATMKMTGADILGALELIGLSGIEMDDEFLVQASGMSYVYNSSRPAGKRVASVMVGGQPLNPAQLYTVTTNEFVPMVLPYYSINPSDVHTCSGDTTEFQVLLKYVAARDTISPTRRSTVTNPVLKVSGGTPKTFSLLQNYPNPFNPSTSISFDVPRVSFVTLKVFNLLGQEIATIVAGNLNPGTYRYSFDAGRLASGVYLYQLRTGDYLQTRKMILMK